MEFAKLNAVIATMNEKQREIWFQRVDKAGLSESQLEVLATKVLQGEIKESSANSGEEMRESMRNLDTKLKNLILKMTPEQLQAYERAKEAAPQSRIESLCALAESCLVNGKMAKLTSLRESFRGRRNNGNQEPISNEAKFRQESDATLHKYLGIPVKEAVPKAVRESSNPFALADFAFAKAIGLSESDAIKVASDNLVEQGGPRRRVVLKD